MATFKKPHHMRGTIDGITYYTYRGKPCARKKSSLTGERLKSDPAFKPTLQAGKRFGKASSIAKALRYAIAPFDKPFSNGRLHNRFISLITSAAKQNPEWFATAEPPITPLTPLTPHLQRFEFIHDRSFDQTVNIECDHYHNADRDDIRLEVAAPHGFAFRKAPSSTHLRILFILAPYGKVTKAPTYDPNRDLASIATWASEWVSATDSFCCCPIIPIPKYMRQGDPILMLLAIEPGFEEGNGEILPAITGRAMRILDILP